MLQQILRDMYIDPEILEELSDDQKQILFFKMREEQIRRWKASEEKLSAEEKLKPVTKKKSGKNVNFFCDENSQPIIEYIEQPDEIDINDLKKKQDEEALKKAEEQARKEAAQKRKELEEIEQKRKGELRKKEETERLKKEQEEKEEAERKAVAAAAAAKLQKEKEEAEQKLLKEKIRKEEEGKEREKQKKKKKEEEENRLKEEVEKKRIEKELAEEEQKRKEEIYESMRKEQEEKLKYEEEESKRLEDEWKERELKAKAAEQQRRNSFSYSKNEFERMRKLAKEKAELEKMRKPGVANDYPNIEISDTLSLLGSTEPTLDSTSSKNSLIQSTTKTRSLPIKRPPLPAHQETRPTISAPVNVTSTRDEVDTIPVQKEVTKPSRPPPPPSKGSPILTRNTGDNKESKLKGSNNPSRPPRPKSKMEVLTWWKEVEYPKLSGLDENKKPMEWFHGIITRHEAEKLLGNKKQGSYLVRVSERVWGYTISFKDIGRCKHFLIDTIHGGYQFFGMEQIVHNSLNELVEYHKKYPISGLGQEVLLYPCGQEKTRADYEHLFVENTTI